MVRPILKCAAGKETFLSKCSMIFPFSDILFNYQCVNLLFANFNKKMVSIMFV